MEMIMEDQIVNAKIRSAVIEIEDHGILTLWLHLDYGGSGQGFGGYSIEKNAGFWMRRIFDVLEVYRWSDVAGNNIRVKIEDGLAKGIGNIIKDKWFYPSKEIIN